MSKCRFCERPIAPRSSVTCGSDECRKKNHDYCRARNRRKVALAEKSRVVRPRADVAKRVCLSCDKTFTSLGRGNRTCYECKARQASEPGMFYMPERHSVTVRA